MRNHRIYLKAVLVAAIWMLVPVNALPGTTPDSVVARDISENFAFFLMANLDLEQARMARDYVQEQGGHIAVLISPHAMVGWISPKIAPRLQGQYGIDRICYEPVDPGSIPYGDARTLQAVSFFNSFTSGLLKEEWAKIASSGTNPVPVNDVMIKPELDFAAYISNLPPGTAPSPGNSDTLTGVVAVAFFFVESDGSIDADTYTWTAEDENNTMIKAISGLTWWASKAALEGYSLSFMTIVYPSTDEACRQGYEPILHSSTEDNLWIDSIMEYLGEGGGDKWGRVYAFNTTLRTTYAADQSYTAFVVYNPPGAPDTFTDGRSVFSSYGGPYLQFLFRVLNDAVGLTLSYETGHIFNACGEAYEAGTGGCTDCGPCYILGPRPYVPNGNCAYCNSGSVDCMMKNFADTLCLYTKYQVGWLPLPQESSGVSSFSVAHGGSYSVTFNASNSRTYTQAGHLNISVSPGLEIIEIDGTTITPGSFSSQTGGGITYVNYPVGYTIGNCASETITATNQLLDVFAEYSTGQNRSFSVTFRAKASATATQRIYHRAAFYVPDNHFVNDPLSGEMDQQGCYARVIEVGVTGAAETVSTPNVPNGPVTGAAKAIYSYTTGGSVSSEGHTVQYSFDWGDGTNSGWLPEGTLAASKAWAAPGTYSVKARARCAIDNDVESSWSDPLSVAIGAVAGCYQVLPEVIWAKAVGAGDWVTEVQITDISGGSIVSAFFNYGGGNWRGPFALWTGTSSYSSAKFSNLLQSIDGLDAADFAYYGRVGAVEFVTQDANHRIRVAARTFNGDYSKTFPGLSDSEANTASTSREMMIQNLTSNASYRSSVGFFNPVGSPVTVEFRLIDGSGGQVGNLIAKTLASLDFQAFNPFTEAGVSYPANSFDNICLYVRPVSGSGRVICFGATADNASNDPASHIAVQNSAGFDNSPGNYKVLPEAIWAKAIGAGDWMTGVQITDTTGGSVVSAYFDYGGGNRRGPFTLSTGTALAGNVKFDNLLETLDGLDAEAFVYYGKVGTVEFITQDEAHKIQVTARTLNGTNSKTFPGLSDVDSNTAVADHPLIVQNYANNATYRSTVGCFNPGTLPVDVRFRLFSGSGSPLGSSVTKTFVAYDFQAFNPFAEAGVTSAVDNVFLEIKPVSGSGRIIGFGATANNNSNDPASHIAGRTD